MAMSRDENNFLHYCNLEPPARKNFIFNLLEMNNQDRLAVLDMQSVANTENFYQLANDLMAPGNPFSIAKNYSNFLQDVKDKENKLLDQATQSSLADEEKRKRREEAAKYQAQSSYKVISQSLSRNPFEKQMEEKKLVLVKESKQEIIDPILESEESLEKKKTLNEIRNLFEDAITFDIFTKIAITPEGHSYEEKALLNHLSKNEFDPKTKTPLTKDKLLENKVALSLQTHYSKDDSELDLDNIPRDLYCPITGKIFDNPIVLTNPKTREVGTYDYSAFPKETAQKGYPNRLVIDVMNALGPEHIPRSEFDHINALSKYMRALSKQPFTSTDFFKSQRQKIEMIGEILDILGGRKNWQHVLFLQNESNLKILNSIPVVFRALKFLKLTHETLNIEHTSQRKKSL